MDRAVTSFEEVTLAFNAIVEQNSQLGARIRQLEKQLDTHGSPLWKRIWFRVNGWPPWWIVAKRPAQRFWHRWTGI